MWFNDSMLTILSDFSALPRQCDYYVEIYGAETPAGKSPAIADADNRDTVDFECYIARYIDGDDVFDSDADSPELYKFDQVELFDGHEMRSGNIEQMLYFEGVVQHARRTACVKIGIDCTSKGNRN